MCLLPDTINVTTSHANPLLLRDSELMLVSLVSYIPSFLKKYILPALAQKGHSSSNLSSAALMCNE